MQPATAAHGAFPARRKLASGSSRAPCAFPNLRCCPRCWLFSCLGLQSHLHIFPKEHQKERCGHSRPQRSFISFYGALRIILLSAGFPVTIHMITLEQTFVNNSLQKFFLLLLPFQIESILSVICLSFLRWIFQRWKIQFRKKRIAVFSHPPIHPMPHPHLQTSPD